eukprot:scaffold3058_cov65-Phaeocystis_antarctica.AAC.7
MAVGPDGDGAVHAGRRDARRGRVHGDQGHPPHPTASARAVTAAPLRRGRPAGVRGSDPRVSAAAKARRGTAVQLPGLGGFRLRGARRARGAARGEDRARRVDARRERHDAGHRRRHAGGCGVGLSALGRRRAPLKNASRDAHCAIGGDFHRPDPFAGRARGWSEWGPQEQPASVQPGSAGRHASNDQAWRPSDGGECKEEG